MRLSELLTSLTTSGMQGEWDLDITGIAFDSRKVNSGDLFVCLTGTVQDGHDFVHDAIGRGAIAIVAEREVSVPRHVPVLIVPDSRVALAVIAAQFYCHPSRKLKLIGVTGTNGKTTTVQLLNHILNESGNPSGTIGTLGMAVGNYTEKTLNTTPESLEIQRYLSMMVEHGAKYAVMEVSSHALKMGRVRDCYFHTGVFTNLTHDHLDYHQSFSDYQDAKKILFSELPPADAGHESYAILNVDDSSSEVYARATKARILTYGISPRANVRAEDICMTPSGTSFTVQALGSRFHVHWRLPGVYNVYNALAALCTGLAHEIPMDRMVAALESFHGVEGRFETLVSRDGVKAIVDYAHNPDALRNLLVTARQLTSGQLYCVFGCEGDRDRYKRPVMANIALELSDFPVLTLDNTRTEEQDAIFRDMTSDYERRHVPKSAYRQIPDRREAIWFALERARPGDVVVIAGKGHETVQILGQTEIPFNDKQVVLEFWSQLGLLS